MALPAEKARYTFADVLAWADEERAELIDGEVVLMAPPPSREHQEISGGLFWQLRYYLRGKKCKVYAAPFAVRLFEKDEDSPEDVDTMVEPDISVICDKEKLSDRGCEGAPDWIIEIVSPSTSRIDCAVKLFKYRTAGVREYWIVDPKRRMVTLNYFEEDLINVAYSFDSTIKVGIYDDLLIGFSAIADLLDI